MPPQSVFAQGRPSHLIIVPACTACHRPTSPGDDYFRSVIADRRDAGDHPDVTGGVLDAAMRGLQRPEARGLSTTFLRSVRLVEVGSHPGLHVGEAPGLEGDALRIMAVVDRIIRGLYFHHTGRALGLAAGVQSMEDTLSDFSHLESEQRTGLTQLVQAVGASEWRHVGKAFSYAYLLVPGDPVSSAWLTRFYRTTTFLTLTRPEQATPPG